MKFFLTAALMATTINSPCYDNVCNVHENATASAMGKTFQSDLSIDNETINNEFESRKRSKKGKR